jgi:phosphate:Na+ symporter
MNQALEIIYQVCGGLGIFLLGMKNMSEGMQAVAGERLRRMIGAVTNNRFMACGLGTLVTMIIQSSSVTTVMVVGLVNAGIMTLMQAIGVIYGANIGTTITAWILVINLGKYGLPLIGMASFFYLFTKRDKIRFTAMFLMGIGMVFFGLELMKNGFSPLKDMPAFIAWFHRFQPDSYWGIWKCILAGAVLTAVIQSSSATIGITLGLAFTGVIDYRTAAALVLGENIGTTITAWLASLGAATNARRAAYAHILFNVIGVCWISLLFPWYTTLISEIVTRTQAATVDAIVCNGRDDPDLETCAGRYKIDGTKLYFTDSQGRRINREGSVLDDKTAYVLADDFEKAIETHTLTNLTAYKAGQTQYPFTQAAIAVTHSGFNILNTLVFIPMVGLMARLLTWLIPERKAAEKPRLTYLNVRMLDTPAIGIQQSFKEIIRMGEIIRQMLGKLKTMLSNEEPNRTLADEIFQSENDLDVMQMEIVGFLGDILSGNISHEVIEESRHQIRIADEYESISDYITAILKLRLKMRDTHLLLSPESIEELNHLHGMVENYFNLVHSTVEQDTGSPEFFSEAQSRGMAVTKYMKECRSRHMNRVEAGKVSPMKSLIYTDMLTSYRRIKDHAFNVAEVMVGEK